jgi:ATP-dependent Clp protease ATP-binding subunit ClpC
MFERFTEGARRTIFFARFEASQLGQISIETEHLLLGLIRERKGAIDRIFAGAKVPLATIRSALERQAASQGKVSTSVEIPFSAEMKHVLQLATTEADALNHSHIGTEHLLLGLLREEKSVAASTLIAHGVNIREVRQLVKELDGSALDVTSGPVDIDAAVAGADRIEVMISRLAAITMEDVATRELLLGIQLELGTLKRCLGQ